MPIATAFEKSTQDVIHTVVVSARAMGCAPIAGGVLVNMVTIVNWVMHRSWEVPLSEEIS
jgi:hypothetical protein